MTSGRQPLRRSWRGALAATALLAASACTATADPTATPSAQPTPAAPATPTPTPVPTPTHSPTPDPTPRFTNPPDPELRALLPGTVNGVPLVVAPLEDVALTPGDVGLVYGEIGLRFASLAVAYVEQPRLALYAVRVEGDPVATADLEPHLATAGRYVGIAGLHPEAWSLAEVGGHLVWTRGGDIATGRSATLYTWSSGEFVFLLIGSDDALNRALVAALPGEAPPPPASAPASASPEASASPAP